MGTLIKATIDGGCIFLLYKVFSKISIAEAGVSFFLYIKLAILSSDLLLNSFLLIEGTYLLPWSYIHRTKNWYAIFDAMEPWYLEITLVDIETHDEYSTRTVFTNNTILSKLISKRHQRLAFKY